MALLLTLVGACSFGGSIGPGYKCGEGETCPDGETCSNGFCTIQTLSADSGGDDVAAPDASGPDGGQSAARCGSLSLLQDDFAGDFGDRWYPWDDPPGATIAVTGGAAVVAIAAGTSDRWAGMDSSIYYDLRGGAFDVEVAQVGGRDTVIEVRGPNEEKAQLLVEDGTLTAAVYNVAGAGIRAEVPYVPGDQRYWRLRGDEDTLYWETSPDRAIWSRLHGEPFPFDPAHTRAILAAGGELATASAARYADVNADAPAGLAYCPAADLVEDFAGGSLDPVWEYWDDPGCSVAETGGALTFTFPTGGGNIWCGISSQHVFDLTSSTYVIDAAGVPGAPSFVTSMAVVDPGDNTTFAEIQRDDDTLYVRQSVNDVTFDADNTPYVAGTQRYWRLRGAGGRVYFDTSGDGTTWATISDAASRLDLSRVRIVIGAGTYNSGPGTAQVVTIAGVNPL
jgi:hypothetical protein